MVNPQDPTAEPTTQRTVSNAFLTAGQISGVVTNFMPGPVSKAVAGIVTIGLSTTGIALAMTDKGQPKDTTPTQGEVYTPDGQVRTSGSGRVVY
jgi:hypothetical protein